MASHGALWVMLAPLLDERIAITLIERNGIVWIYFSTANVAHCSKVGGIVLAAAFRSARITFLSVEQNTRLPVRSKTSGAAPTEYVVFSPPDGLPPTAAKRYPDFTPPARL